MKKILTSIALIAGIGVLVIGASNAFFSDTETSEGNTFIAGAIDLKVDYSSYYNRIADGTPDFSWTLTDLTTEKFFDFKDIKPGDYGEGTISMHVFNNNAWACVTIDPTLNDDMSSTEPELEAGDVENTDSIFDGELAQNMQFKIWADTCSNNAEPGDNIFQDGCDRLLTEGTGPITPVTWPLASPTTPNVFTGVEGPLVGSNNYYLGVEWSIPGEVGNIIQTDKYMADISFYVEQERNNDQFVCPIVGQQEPNVLRLENEREVAGGPWEVVVDDMWVDMAYNSSGPTFDYTLNGQGLATSTPYSLIYYADGWPGNHPGALIGEHSTDGSGNLSVGATSKELNMDLPHVDDGNYAVGAKIWLIPSSAYNSGTNSVTAWPPNFDTWLFEGNVYIHYNDTP